MNQLNICRGFEMNAKEAYELSNRSDGLKIQTMKTFEYMIESIKNNAICGYTNAIFTLNPFTDYDYVADKFKRLGYEVELNDNGIKIDWSEPK